MAQRRSLAWTELKVGLLVIAGFAVLAYAIVRIGGTIKLLGENDPYHGVFFVRQRTPPRERRVARRTSCR